MPTTPVWFQARDYFANKLADMPYAAAEDGPQQLMDAFNAAGFTVDGLNPEQLNASAEQLYRHFVEYGNAENVSPNNYFNVDTYIQNKLDQLAGLDPAQKPPYPFTSWSKDALDAAMQEAGLSYWDHYAKYGTEEGINPSAQFNTNAYLDAKAAQLNALPEGQKQLLPDGTEGTWDRATVAQALANAGLSALEHYYDYGIAEKVDYQPLPEPQPEIYYKDINLADVESPVVGTADNENFIGTVASSQSNSTLLPSTSIDGNGGIDKLTVDMTGNFRGFDEDAGLKGINEIELNNNGTQSRSFNAAGIEGVKVWTLNEGKGELNLTNLAETGITVNVNGLGGNDTTNINFAKNIDSNSDELTIGLDNVGQVTRQGEVQQGEVNVNNVTPEQLTLNLTGDNYVDLTGVTGIDEVIITGEGNLQTQTLGGDTLDASAATGNLKIAMTTEDFQNATLGSGDDTLTITNMEETSQIDGGDGDDTIVINGLTGRYMPGLASVETLNVNTDGNVYLDGTDIDGLETLGVSGLGVAEKLTLQHYDSGELNVNSTGLNAGELQIADIDNINFVVEGSSRQTQISSFTGKLYTEDASSLSLTVQGSTEYANTFTGDIIGNDLEELNISADRNNLVSKTTDTVAIGGGSELTNVNQVSVTGFGNVNLGKNLIGNDTGDLTIDATTLDADLEGEFATNVDNSSIIINGGNRENVVRIDMKGYSDVEFNGGIDNDTLTLDLTGTNGVISKGMVTANLGGGYGQDTLLILGNVTKADFRDVAGVENIVFQDMTAAQIAALGDNLLMPEGYTMNGGKPTPGIAAGGGYVATPNVMAGGITDVPAGTKMTADASQAPDPSNINVSNANLGAGSTLDVNNIQSTATISTPASGGEVELAATPGKVATDWTVNANGAKGSSTELTINQGKATEGTDQALTINNNGEGSLSFVTTDDLGTITSSGGENYQSVKYSQSELVINNNGGGVTETGNFITTSTSGTSKVASTYMPNMTNVDINGDGDVVLEAQIGSNSNSLIFDAQGSTGTVTDALLLGTTINYIGSQGTDHMSFAPYASGSDINLGTGEDQIFISSSYMKTAAQGKNYGLINVHLGEDDAKDQVLLYAGGNGNNDGKAALIQIDQFGSSDQLAYDNTGAASGNHFYGENSGSDTDMLAFMNLVVGANTFTSGANGNTTFNTVTWGTSKSVLVATVTGTSDVAGQYIIGMSISSADTLPTAAANLNGQYALVQVIGASPLDASNFCAYADIAGSPF